ncbi:MAG: DUF2065 domain-containing protein [Pseudomonadota bacterium]
MLSALIYGLALVLVIEGLIYAVFPNLPKMVAEETARRSADEMRFFGVAALALGVFLLFLIL